MDSVPVLLLTSQVILNKSMNLREHCSLTNSACNIYQRLTMFQTRNLALGEYKDERDVALVIKLPTVWWVYFTVTDLGGAEQTSGRLPGPSPWDRCSSRWGALWWCEQDGAAEPPLVRGLQKSVQLCDLGQSVTFSELSPPTSQNSQALSFGVLRDNTKLLSHMHHGGFQCLSASLTGC